MAFSGVHLHIEKPMELFAEQLVWALCTPPTAAELIFSAAGCRDARSGPEAVCRPHFDVEWDLQVFYVSLTARRAAIARPTYKF
jgi:hypothetical protein